MDSNLKKTAILLRLGLPFVIILVGWAGYLFLSIEDEKPKKEEADKRTIKTRATDIVRTNYPVSVKTHGFIRPHNEVTLTTEVAGRIIDVAPAFETGNFFDEGDILLSLDSSDYEAAAISAKAQLARAEAQYALERTRSDQAKLNWEDLGYREEPNELVLRLPQVRETKAAVDAAKAQLERAERNLERTKIRAPFAGRVRQRNVGLGQSVGTNTPLGTIFAVDYAEVRLPVSGRQLRFLRLPESTADPALPVTLSDALNEHMNHNWKAKIVRTEGILDPNSLELFAIARVDDPFGLNSESPPLRIGQPVTGYIQGQTLTNVIALPRSSVRQLDQIYLIERETLSLERRSIEALWEDQENVFVEDIHDADRFLVSTTHIIYAAEDATVELIPDIPTDTASTGSKTAGNTNATIGSP